jgi:putative membrane-bound dehydrogenase-like protein
MSIRRCVVVWMLGMLIDLTASAGTVQIGDHTFHLPDGFTIERVAGPPVVMRPVTADFDELGRLYVADSSGSRDDVKKQLAEKPHRILRLEAANANGVFEKSRVFAVRMMFPEGTLWYRDALYVSAPPSIWKLSEGGGRAEWFAGKTLTGCANDLHGPYLGPDGWIYWCKGAFAQQTYELPNHKTLVTKAAHIFRARPDGLGIEPVMTGGMDNPVHVVFTPGGERIFSTTFLQNPAGGKRDGLIHAVYGGVYGKVHDVLDGHIRTSPDVMPVLSHLGPAAACGLVRYESDALGPEFKDNLFTTCFNLHKVTRHVLTAQGATFSSVDSDFLMCDHVDFHPTDILEDADGSLLVVDTGGWYKLCCPTSQLVKPDVLGAIYRVRRVDAPPVEDPRGLRLEWSKLNAATLAKLLDDPRAAIRKRAIQELADKGEGAIPDLKSQIANGSARARINAVWAATRIEGVAARELVRAALRDSDELVRQAAAHSVSLWRDREAVPALVELLGRGTPQNRRVAAEALGRLGDAKAVAAVLAALEQPVDRVLEHSLIYAMIEIGDAGAVAKGLESPSAGVRRGAIVALDQMGGGKLTAEVVARELASPEAPMRDTAAWVASRHPDWGEAMGGVLIARMTSPTLTADDTAQLERQLASLAKSPAIEALIAAQLTHDDAAQQRIALAAVADSGLRRPPALWLEAIKPILAGSDRDLAAAAIGALRKLPVDKAAAAQLTELLLAAGGRSDLVAPVRLDALSALPAGTPLPSEAFSFLLTELAPATPAPERLASASIVSRAKLTDEQLLALCNAVTSAAPLEIDRLLSAFDHCTDPAVGEKLLASLSGSKALATLRPESLGKHLAKFPSEMQQKAQPLLSGLNPDAEKQRARIESLLATLPEGDVRRGQLVFNSTKTACASCHQIGYVGGNVGPDLTRVGAIRQKRDLLESILYPSASFVQSFEPMIVDTADGDRLSGLIRRNDAEEVMLVTGPNQEVHVPRAKVKSVKPGTVSVMPEGIDQQLSPQELGDLVAFLQQCK